MEGTAGRPTVRVSPGSSRNEAASPGCRAVHVGEERVEVTLAGERVGVAARQAERVFGPVEGDPEVDRVRMLGEFDDHLDPDGQAGIRLGTVTFNSQVQRDNLAQRSDNAQPGHSLAGWGPKMRMEKTGIKRAP